MSDVSGGTIAAVMARGRGFADEETIRSRLLWAFVIILTLNLGLLIILYIINLLIR